jgi:hypothetical protein
MQLLWCCCVLLCLSADLLWMVAALTTYLAVSCLATYSSLTTNKCRHYMSSVLKRCFVLLCAYAFALAIFEALFIYLFVLPLLVALSGTMLLIDRCLIWFTSTSSPGSPKLDRAQRRAAVKESRREAKRRKKYYKNLAFWEKCLWQVFSILPAVFRCAFLMCYLMMGLVACSLAYQVVRLALLALAYLLAALIIWLWAIVVRVLLVCAFVKQHDAFKDGGVESYFAWSDRLGASRLATVDRSWMPGCCRRRNRLLGGSPKAIEAKTLVQVRHHPVQSANGEWHYYWRVTWLREDVSVPVAAVGGDNAVAEAIANQLKNMLEERGPRRTQKADVKAYRDELVAAAISGQQAEADAAVVADAAPAGPEERATPRASYPKNSVIIFNNKNYV